jgi:hypothetical protein
MATSKNIVVGAARAFISYGQGNNRPDLSSANIFPWNITSSGTSQSTSAPSSASTQSTPQFLLGTASSYWRDLGFTSNGVEISYEPGYNDVVVDQLLDAARLFQHTLKITMKTELDEATFENMNIVWGQPEYVVSQGANYNLSASAIVNNLSTVSTASNTSSTVSAAYGNAVQFNMFAGAVGNIPQERTLVFAGAAPGYLGQYAQTPATSSGSAIVNSSSGYIDYSSYKSKERVYVARRVVQDQTTAHSLKRDGVTVFPVQFRCLPDTDRANVSAGSDYGFIIDRVYGNV